jgi:hypothetical protein
MAMKWTLLTTSALLAFASAQEVDDWRLELLKESGLSAETEALEKFQKGLSQPDGNLDKMVQQLGSEEFKEREQAQKEILLLGKNVLPQLRPMLNSDDPEIRMRLTAIMNQMEVGGRWAKDNLLREAVNSLLEERKNPDADKPNAKLFVEFFNKDAASVSDGYQRLKFKTGVGVAGSVKDGMARLNGKHDRDGDQQLLLLAKDLTGNEEFPDSFRIESKIGGGGEGMGSFHVGISVGNVRALFHPGYQNGAFRIEQVSNNIAILGNTDMTFTPPSNKLLLMSLDIKRLPNKDVEISVKINHEKQTFRTSQIVKADAIGKLDRIALDRSGRNGGDAIFDDLIVDLK